MRSPVVGRPSVGPIIMPTFLFSSAYELKAQAELMRSPVVRRPSVLMSFRPSVLLSVNFGDTNLDGKTYRVQMWSVDTLREWLLPILELGHSDLLCGFYRAKFTFPMYFNGN